MADMDSGLKNSRPSITDWLWNRVNALKKKSLSGWIMSKQKVNIDMQQNSKYRLQGKETKQRIT